MDNLLRHIPDVTVYQDDILVHSRTEEEHLATLEQVLSIMQNHNLRISYEKCKFMRPEVKFLGYRLSEGEIRALPNKIKDLLSAPAPRSAKELQSFMGLITYYSRFIKDLATRARCLYSMMGKKSVFTWDDEKEEVFQELKNTMASDPVLRTFDPRMPAVLYTDASSVGLGV